MSLFLLLLIGCNLGPKYEPPPVAVPEEWKAADPHVEEIPKPCVDYWWEVFGDATLNNLEIQAIANNPTLEAAVDRIIEARANAGIAEADLYPQISINPSYTKTSQLFKLYLPPNAGSNLGNAAVTPNPLGNVPTIYRINQLQLGLLANMNYELDLWGKLRGQYRSAALNAQAQSEAFRSALLTLTSDVANYYYQLRSFDTQIEVLKSSIEVRRKGFEIAKNRFKKGITTYSEEIQASLELSNTEAEYYEAVRQRTLMENQIAVLIGVPASVFSMQAMPLFEPPPRVPAGLPSEVLQQRPDIAQVERQMASEHAKIGVAYASFYPSIQLTGALGFLSPDLKNFLKWKSRFWKLGVNVLQTFIDGDRNAYNLELAIARYKEVSENYKQQVLIAFREVEDSLNNIEMQSKQNERLQISVDAARTSAKLSLQRYNSGLTNYIEVVDTERSQLEAERSYYSILANRYLSTVQLIKALGGAWTHEELFDSTAEEPPCGCQCDESNND